MRPGSPIGGIIVKGGKNPGGSLRTIQTNENGEFEFTGLDAGDYTFAVEQKVFIEDETPVTVAGHGSGNSTILDSRYDGSVVNESDVRNGITLRWTPLVPKPKEPVTYRLRVWQLMQGQNGTQAMRSNKPIVEKSVIDVTETTVQGILTGPCKPPYLCDFIWNAQAISSDGKLMSSGNDGQTGSFSVAQPDNDGGAITKVQDHNSSRSNKSAVLDSRYDGSIINESDAKSVITLRWTPLVPKPKEPVTYRLRVWQLMQGQNGTQAMRSNKPVVEKSVTDVTETSIQGILTGPCKPPYLCDFIWSAQAISGGKLISNGNDNAARSFSVAQPDNDESAVTKAQDHNSSRSNKTASTISTDPNPNDETNAKTKDNMPIKWAAPESTRRTINTTRDNIKRMLVSLDDLEEQLDGDMTNARSIINTSRSNIKSQRMAAYDLRETLTNIEYTEKAQAMNELNQQMTDMNGQLTELLEVLKQMGSQYSSISNVLKTRHDTVKNSIGNIR
jgi:hypothetical protein